MSSYPVYRNGVDLQISGWGSYVKKPYVMGKSGVAVRKELDRREVAANSPLQTVFIDF
jgi:hypothetical protein